MKKLAIISIIACIAGIAFSVTTITYNIPDAKALEYLDVFIAQSGAEITLRIERDGENPYSAKVQFYTPAAIDPATATNAQKLQFFRKRVALFSSAMRAAHDQKLKDESDKAYLAAMPVIPVDEPDPDEMN